MIFYENITSEGRTDFYIDSRNADIPEITHWYDDKVVEIGDGVIIPERIFITIAKFIKATMEE